MKKIILIALALSFVFSVAVFASSKVDEIPAVGIKTDQTSLSSLYGKIGYSNNGNTYRVVLNSSGQSMIQGYPAFYLSAEANDYACSTFEANGYLLEYFGGIWYCDLDGNKTITNGEYGWVQVGGYCSAASVEGTTDIGVGDVLIGKAGYNYLVKGRASYSATMKGVGTASTEVDNVYGPRAVTAYTTNSAGLTDVRLRSGY